MSPANPVDPGADRGQGAAEALSGAGRRARTNAQGTPLAQGERGRGAEGQRGRGGGVIKQNL